MKCNARKAAWLASLGAGLEYYDFVIYGMMASYLGSLFFPDEESWTGLLKAFGVFAVGYLARPLGGIFFGAIGDVYGRKRTFLAVMILMAFSTFSIGMLPTHAQMGMTSSLLLVLLRLLQGFSFGAELPGAITVICEYSKKERHGSYAGYVISSMSLGATLASLVLYLLSLYSSKEEILEWAWRVPFLLGGVLACASYYIRNQLQETPEFSLTLSQRSHSALKDPLMTLGKGYRKEVILGIGMTWLHAALVIFYIYLPTFLSQYYGYSSSDIYFAVTCGMIWSAMSLPLAGILSDKIGKNRMFAGVCLIFLILGYGLFQVLNIRYPGILIGFMMLYQTIISFLAVSFLPLLSGLFPTQMRYTGIALCYNVTYSLMACLPLVTTFFIQFYNSPTAGIVLLLLCAAISAAASFLLFKRNRLPILQE